MRWLAKRGDSCPTPTPQMNPVKTKEQKETSEETTQNGQGRDHITKEMQDGDRRRKETEGCQTAGGKRLIVIVHILRGRGTRTTIVNKRTTEMMTIVERMMLIAPKKIFIAIKKAEIRKMVSILVRMVILVTTTTASAVTRTVIATRSKTTSTKTSRGIERSHQSLANLHHQAGSLQGTNTRETSIRETGI